MNVYVKTNAVKNSKETKKRRFVAIPYMGDSSKSSTENGVNDTHVANEDIKKKDNGKRKIIALPMKQNSELSEDSSDSGTTLSVKHKESVPLHVGDKPFGCNECGARFTKKSSLQVHE